MSELVNNLEYRQKVLKELVLELHEGKFLSKKIYDWIVSLKANALYYIVGALVFLLGRGVLRKII